MKKTVFQLETLTCPSCVRRIEGTVGKQKGVSEAVVKFNASKVEVNYDDTMITTESIQDMLTKLGYPVLSTK